MTAYMVQFSGIIPGTVIQLADIKNGVADIGVTWNANHTAVEQYLFAVKGVYQTSKLQDATTLVYVTGTQTVYAQETNPDGTVTMKQLATTQIERDSTGSRSRTQFSLMLVSPMSHGLISVDFAWMLPELPEFPI